LAVLGRAAEELSFVSRWSTGGKGEEGDELCTFSTKLIFLIGMPQERSTRIFCCVFISDLAQAVTDACGSKQGPVSFAAINTAKLFFQRFYMNQSLAKQKNYKVIPT
jgi:hypothetical protein